MNYFVSCEEFRKGPIETRTAKRWEVVADFVLSDVDPQVGNHVTSISLKFSQFKLMKVKFGYWKLAVAKITYR